MSLILLMLAAAHAASCPPTTFEFVGQPECVALAFHQDRTHVSNGCAQPLLIDQSVVFLESGRVATGIVPPDGSVEIRDLNAFTLGMDGVLYRVLAMIAEDGACETVAQDTADTGK